MEWVRHVWLILAVVVAMSAIQTVLVGNRYFRTVIFIFFNLLSVMRSHCDYHYCAEIRSIILIRSLYGRELITIDSVGDITWFTSRSTSPFPIIPVFEGTHIYSIILLELAIMLSVGWKISLDKLVDSKEI